MPGKPAAARPAPSRRAHWREVRRLVAFLVIYYAVVSAAVAVVLWIWPGLHPYLPVGAAGELIRKGNPDILKGTGVNAEQVRTFGQSMIWLSTAMGGALLTAFPVSRVYLSVRDSQEYDQSIISTIVVLPVVVTGIVVIVQHSLALAFSLAGIAGAVRFRNSLKSSGDALFILLAVGTGIAAGIGAVELAIVMSIAFNLCFLGLWTSEYGERKSMKRFLRDFSEDEPTVAAAAPPPSDAGA